MLWSTPVHIWVSTDTFRLFFRHSSQATLIRRRVCSLEFMDSMIADTQHKPARRIEFLQVGICYAGQWTE